MWDKFSKTIEISGTIHQPYNKTNNKKIVYKFNS